MPSTLNLTRQLRKDSAPGLLGTESLTVENLGIPDQVISAGVEEQTAMGAFKDSQLQAMALLCDQDVEAMFLGVRYAIADLNVVGPDTITHAGDLTQEFNEGGGDLVRIEGTATGDDGIYAVDLVAEALGETTLTLAPGILWPTGGGGAVGTFARVCSKQILGYSYSLVAGDGGSADVNGELVIPGDISDKFAAGEFIWIESSTGNDAFWIIMSVVTDGPPVTQTTITVADPNVLPLVAALPSAVDDGHFCKCLPSYRLKANVPKMWSIAAGDQNPFIHPGYTARTAPVFNEFRGDVAFLMVNNQTITNANFAGRIGTNAIIY